MFEWSDISIAQEVDTPRIIRAWEKHQSDMTRVPPLKIDTLREDISSRSRVIITLSKGQRIEGLIEFIRSELQNGLYYSRTIPAGTRSVTALLPALMRDIPECHEIALPQSANDRWLYGRNYLPKTYTASSGVHIPMVHRNLSA